LQLSTRCAHLGGSYAEYAIAWSHTTFHKQPEFENNEELGFAMSRYLTRALQDRSFSGHPYEIRPGGLAGVEQALRDLRDGKASAMKSVFRIADTPE
jgi:hypothetical protein